MSDVKREKFCKLWPLYKALQVSCSEGRNMTQPHSFAYFHVEFGNWDKEWTAHVACNTYGAGLRYWHEGEASVQRLECQWSGVERNSVR